MLEDLIMASLKVLSWYLLEENEGSAKPSPKMTMLRSGQLGSIPGKGSEGIFSPRRNVQTESGTHTTSYPVSTEGS